MKIIINCSSTTSKQTSSVIKYLQQHDVVYELNHSDCFCVKLVNKDGCVVSTLNKFSNDEDVILLERILLKMNLY